MECRVIERKRGTSVLEMVLREGKKRQIRRALAQLGLKVLDLQRIAIGRLQLGSLPEGEWRLLTNEEISLLNP